MKMQKKLKIVQFFCDSLKLLCFLKIVFVIVRLRSPCHSLSSSSPFQLNKVFENISKTLLFFCKVQHFCELYQLGIFFLLVQMSLSLSVQHSYHIFNSQSSIKSRIEKEIRDATDTALLLELDKYFLSFSTPFILNRSMPCHPDLCSHKFTFDS